jgi:hypothetical protein
MIRKIGLSVGMATLALVFAAGITTGAMAQSQSSAVTGAQPNVPYNASDNKPGGASASQPTAAKSASDNKPGGPSTVQPPVSANPSANKPGG